MPRIESSSIKKISSLIPYIILIIIVILFIINQIYIAHYIYNIYSSKPWRNAYVSDEIYYVSTARNFLVKIFSLRSIRVYNNYFYFTIFFKDAPEEDVIVNLIKKYDIDLLDTTYSRSYVVTIVAVMDNTNKTFYKYYGGANAIYIRSCYIENIDKFISDLELMNYSVIDVIPGWAYPDKAGINNYFNLEHPPLGKYLIALSILVLGDNPIAWRIPSLVATIIIFVLSYFICVEVLRDMIGYRLSKWVSLLSPIILYFDSSLRTVGVLAMLDPYVALFTIIGVYFFVKNSSRSNDLVKKFSWVLAGLSKFSGLFIVPADVIDKAVFGSYSLKDRFKVLLRELFIYVILFTILLIVFSLPLITYIGFNEWLRQSIIDAFKWHTKTKHALTSGPPTTSPIDWLFGWNAFPLWYDPQTGRHVKCVGLPPIYLASFILNLLFAPIILKLEKPRRIWLSFYSIWFMYMVLYIIGNRSLYSFYIIQFSPLLVIQFIVCISILFKTVTETRNNKQLISSGLS